VNGGDFGGLLLGFSFVYYQDEPAVFKDWQMAALTSLCLLPAPVYDVGVYMA